MTSGSTGSGAPGSPGAPPVAPDPDRDKIRQARTRTDRIYGIGLFVAGIFATIVNMQVFTVPSLAPQYAALYEQYGLGDYARPDGLEPLSLVGVIGHPIIYAVALYLALLAWRRGRLASWIALVGAVVAFLFSGVLMAVGIAMHPELLQAATSGATPTATP